MIPGLALGAIHAAFERCQRRFPTIQLTLEQFLARVEEAVGDTPAGAAGPDAQAECGPWLEAFGRVHHEELFLALACAAGDRIAWEYFAEEYLPLIERLAVRACKTSEEGRDLSQDVVAGLLAPGEGRASRLAGYNGRGSLGGWLRVTVAHAAIDRFRRARKQVSLDELEEKGDVPAAATDSSTAERIEARLDARWGPVLSRLLEEELGRLPARERLLLALYYLEGVPLRAIGRRFGVHEATASRWLDDLRRGMRKRIERELRRRHGLASRDLEQLWKRLSESDLKPLGKMLAD